MCKLVHCVEMHAKDFRGVLQGKKRVKYGDKGSGVVLVGVRGEERHRAFWQRKLKVKT